MLTFEEYFEVCTLLRQPNKSKWDVERLLFLFGKWFGKEIFNKAQTMIQSVIGYRNYMLAEDWVQEVWILTIKRDIFNRYDPKKVKVANVDDGPARLFRYVYKRMLIDFQRKLRRDLVHSRRVEVYSIGDPTADPARDVVHKLHDQKIGDHIRTAISRLPEKQRVAYELTRYSGLSYKEASNIIGVNINSFKSRIRAANKNLRSMLGHVYDELNA